MKQIEIDSQEGLEVPFRNEETAFKASYQLRRSYQKFRQPFTSCTNFFDTFVSFVPIVGWLPHYDYKQNLLSDVVGGFTTGIMHIPQGIAYATLSGVEPVYGLYSSFFPPLLYMLFGSSKHCSIGSFAVIALMSGIANERVLAKQGALFSNSTDNSTLIGANAEVTPIQVASTLTFALGIIQLIAGLLRLQFLTTYFSDQLVAGYTTASAVHVLINQFDEVLGIKIPKVNGPGYLFRRIYDLIVRLPETNLFTLMVSSLSMLFLYLGKEHINPMVNKVLSFKLPIPFEIILMALGTSLSYFFNFSGAHGTVTVGNVPRGMPRPQLPVFRILPDCFISVSGIAVVSIAVHISMAKMFANKFSYNVDSGKEFYALGLSSTLSSFFPVYPTGTALGRTMVSVQSGVKTQFATVFSCLLLLVSILWLGPLLKTLPMVLYPHFYSNMFMKTTDCVLAGIIIMALRSMLGRVTELKKLWLVSKVDFSIWLFAFIVTIAVDVMEGLALSILFALLTVIFRFQWPRVRHLVPTSSDGNWSGKVTRFKISPDEPAVYIYCFEAPLIFTNVDFFKKSVSKIFNNWNVTAKFEEDKRVEKERFFILDCSCMAFVDSMGIKTLEEVVIVAKNFSATVLFASVNSNVLESLEVTNFFSKVSKETFYGSVNDAVRNPSKKCRELKMTNGLLHLQLYPRSFADTTE